MDIANRYHTDEAHIDEVLRGLVWAISNNAERFRIVPGRNMRVGFAFGQHPVPALMVYFRIVDDEQAELLWVQEDEGGYSFHEAF